jgi:hypothetical protein
MRSYTKNTWKFDIQRTLDFFREVVSAVRYAFLDYRCPPAPPWRALSKARGSLGFVEERRDLRRAPSFFAFKTKLPLG